MRVAGFRPRDLDREPVPVAVLNWVLTGAWARPAMTFDIAHARPGWSDPLAL